MHHLCCVRPNLKETRHVLIIGGGNGIGYCLTKTLLETTNDRVISCDIDLDSSLKPLHNELSQNNDSRFHIHPIDVTQRDSIQKCIGHITGLGITYIDRVVICCGIYNGAPLLEISENAFTSTFNVNVIGIWRVIKMLWTNQLLKYHDDWNLNDKNDNSRVIVISSETATSHPMPFGEPYGITKNCLQNLCRTLKIELSTIGIDVVTINPGAVQTQLLNDMESRFARSGKDSPFREACALSIQCKDTVMKYSTVHNAQYIVDNALLWAIHCDRKWLKSEYYIGRTWASYIQDCIPRMMFDRMMMLLFRSWNWYRDSFVIHRNKRRVSKKRE